MAAGSKGVTVLRRIGVHQYADADESPGVSSAQSAWGSLDTGRDDRLCGCARDAAAANGRVPCSCRSDTAASGSEWPQDAPLHEQEREQRRRHTMHVGKQSRRCLQAPYVMTEAITLFLA